MATNGGDEFPENELYQQFPEGREQGYGTGEGFNTYVKLNDVALFRPEALERNAALREFVNSDQTISIYWAQTKSSTRESEWMLHKPHLTMDAESQKRDGGLPADLDIDGGVDRYPGPEHAHIATFVINHEMTLARWKQSVILIEDGKQAGQMIYKHPPEDKQGTHSGQE
ncbi:MAG: hypothetical protein M3153_02240 [Chloroflexota bacterium]|nr:hypothetical protein [Chloroflexota bacterium]